MTGSRIEGDEMQAVLISVFVGIFVYTIVFMMLPVPEKVIVKERISKYFKKNRIEDIEDQVIRERYEKNQKKNQGV